MRTVSLERQFIPVMLFSYPILLLTLRGGMNGVFFLLAAISIFFLFSKRHGICDGYAVAFCFAMASYMAAIFLSQLYHLDLKFQPYDAASRFLLAVPIYLMLRQMNVVSVLQYGFPLGAIAAAAVILIQPRDWGDHRMGSQWVNPIHFGDLALILGFLSWYAIDWVSKDRILLRMLKVAGLGSGLYVSMLTGARGGWIAIPVLILIWMKLSGKSLKKVALAAVALACCAVAGYFLVGIIHERVDAIFNDLAVFSQGNKDTSTGERLQIWKAAIQLFGQNPIFGVGPDGFRQLMPSLAQSGMITPTAAAMGAAEVHNELLAKSVALGLFGLVSMLSIYLVPLYIFTRLAKSATGPKKKAAMLGICLVGGFFIFGLTVEIFSLKMIATFYGLTVAALLAATTQSDSANNLFGAR